MLPKVLQEMNNKLDRILDLLEGPGVQSPDAFSGPDAFSAPDAFSRFGLSADQRAALREAGYTSRAALAAATDADLLAVKGIGEATVKHLREQLR